jgi:uncharacterized protein YbaR (Trm112 family)
MQQHGDVEIVSGMTVPVDMMVCPKCKGALDAGKIEAQPYLCCAACKLAYPVKDGIPLMLQDEAVTL